MLMHEMPPPPKPPPPHPHTPPFITVPAADPHEQVALDVANGCHYLHRQKPMIVHRDLKSQNILLTKDGRCKIADFGLSKIFQNEVAGMTGQIGTLLRSAT